VWVAQARRRAIDRREHFRKQSHGMYGGAARRAELVSGEEVRDWAPVRNR